MKFVAVLIAMMFALNATGSVFAQGRGGGQAHKPTVSAPKAKTSETPKHTTTHPTKTKSRGVETRTAKAEARAAKADARTARKAGTTTTTTVTDVTPTTPTTRTVKNPKLEARLLALLPPGSTIQGASAGFKNWGQFMAAAHVSSNLGIPFDNLKAAMTGIAPGATTPTTTPMSLGQAVQTLKGTSPETETLSSTKIREEVKKAEDAANADLRRSRGRS